MFRLRLEMEDYLASPKTCEVVKTWLQVCA